MLSASAEDIPKVSNKNGIRRENVALIGVLIFAFVWCAYCGCCISAEYQSQDENLTCRNQRLPTISFFPNCFKVAKIHMVVKCR